MIDVFVKVWASSKMRLAMSIAVLERLAMMPDAHVHVIGSSQSLDPFKIQWPWSIEWQVKHYIGVDNVETLAPDRFWIYSKQYADASAQSPIYVVIDDDHLPIGKDWLSRGVAALAARPEFGMLSSWSINGEVPEGASDDPEVFPAHSIGCPYFCRAQSLGELPDGELKSYDQTLSAHVVRNVGKIGFLRNVRFNHVGFGLSQVIPEWWLA